MQHTATTAPSTVMKNGSGTILILKSKSMVIQTAAKAYFHGKQ